MDDKTKQAIVEQLNTIIVDSIPDATFRSMYGGTVIELIKDDPKSRIGGIFKYANYVSLELTAGALFDDPNSVLEGSGKFRRHVKLHAVADVTKKRCVDFLSQARAHA